MIEVYCVRGNGDKEMSEITDALLTSTESAIKRGKYEIDKQWYLVYSQTIDVPFKKTNDSTAIMDGDIISIFDGELGISGNKRISSITISGNDSDVGMSIVTSGFEEYLWRLTRGIFMTTNLRNIYDD